MNDFAQGIEAIDIDSLVSGKYFFNEKKVTLDNSNALRMDSLILENLTYSGATLEFVEKGEVSAAIQEHFSSKLFGNEQSIIDYKIYHIVAKGTEKKEILENHYKFLQKLGAKLYLPTIEKDGRTVHAHPPTVFLSYQESIEKYLNDSHIFGSSRIMYQKGLTSKARKKISTLALLNLNSL